MCPGDDLRYGRPHPKRVRLVGDRDELDVALTRDRVERVELEVAFVIDVEKPQRGPSLLGQHLPRHEVGVVLEHRRDDHVPGTTVLHAIRLGDEVERLSRIARKDHFAARRCVQQRGNGIACRFEGIRALHAERVDAAMHVGIRGGVEARHGVEHLLRLLRRRGRVEIGQWLSVQFSRENRKIGADAG